MIRLAWLAFEGLDWDLAQALIDAGRMPCLAQLVTAGSSGPMAIPPPLVPAATATTLATGVLADRHGVCHTYAPRPDGLTLSPIGLESVRQPSLWLHAAAAGQQVRIAGWPASLPNEAALADTPMPAQIQVAGLGFELSGHATPEHWPLSPDLLWPPSLRATVAASLIHPDEIGDDIPRSLCGEYADGLLRQSAGEFVARTASVQALGLAWLAQADAALLALRFNALPAWTTQLHARAGIRLPEAITPTYQWLDLVIGRWMNQLGRNVHMAVTTEGGLPGAGYRRAQGRSRRQGGGLVLAGPGVPQDALIGPASPTDVCPTLLHLLGLLPGHAPAHFDGRNLFAAPPHTERSASHGAQDKPQPPRVETVDQDASALNDLAHAGMPPVDVGPMRALVHRVVHESTRTWAWIRRLRGHFDEACDHLDELSASDPADATALLMLAECLLAAGHHNRCAALRERLPAERQGLEWDALEVLLDYASQDWIKVENGIERLMQQDQRWINPAAWLGWSLYRRGEHQRALEALTRAADRPEEPMRVREGLGRVLLQLGRPREALQSIERAIAEQPYSAVLHRLRGDALHAAGQAAAAVEAWLRAWTLAPTLPGLAEQLGRATQREQSRMLT